MIFYGSRATLVASDTLYNAACPHCGTNGQTEGAVYARYAHVYWIPVFPMSKKATSECKHCLRTFVEGSDTLSLQPAYDDLKSRAKTPIWHWSGMALLVLAMVMGSISNNKSAEDRQKFIVQPEIGDVYHVKMSDGNYTTMKIKAVTPDSVSMFLNTLSVNKITGITKLERATAYTDSLTGDYAKAELKTMLDNNEIIEIKR
jgi:uncharacterized protein with FMN-binding domain